MNIDLVITYVDNTNEDWLEKYNEQAETSYPMYFRTNPNALKYLLRSVEANLPFINQVFLVVQNASEVPSYIDTEKVRIVTHEEFIPERYLPTFNSTTIESFLANINDLSEHFLYMNDDCIILNQLEEANFYTSDDNAIAYFYAREFIDGEPSGFEEILINDADLIYGINRSKSLKKG